jgi:hypothetical protein
MLISTELMDWSGYVSEMAGRLGGLALQLAEVRQHAGTRAIAEREFDYGVLAQRLAAFACRIRR